MPSTLANTLAHQQTRTHAHTHCSLRYAVNTHTLEARDYSTASTRADAREQRLWRGFCFCVCVVCGGLRLAERTAETELRGSGAGVRSAAMRTTLRKTREVRVFVYGRCRCLSRPKLRCRTRLELRLLLWGAVAASAAAATLWRTVEARGRSAPTAGACCTGANAFAWCANARARARGHTGRCAVGGWWVVGL